MIAAPKKENYQLKQESQKECQKIKKSVENRMSKS